MSAHHAATKSEERSPEYWAPRLRDGWERFEGTMRDGLQVAIELGRTLIEAKAAIGHGGFGQLFADQPEPIWRPMPFSDRWARKLMALAAHPTLGNRKHASDLPSDIDAVAMLASLSEEEVEEAIEKGRVTKSTTRAEVKRIVNDLRPRPTVEEMLASPRVQALAVDQVRPAEYSPEDDDHPTLAGLKRYWRKAGKRIKQQFLQWIERRM